MTSLTVTGVLTNLTVTEASAEDGLQVSLGELTNQTRASVGVATLGRDPTLDAEAQAWADHLASLGGLEHSSLTRLRGLGFSAAAENIGYGPVDPALINQLFVASPRHHQNMTDARWTVMGLGVVVRGDTLWVAELFGARATPSTRQQARPPANAAQPGVTRPARVNPHRRARSTPAKRAAVARRKGRISSVKRARALATSR